MSMVIYCVYCNGVIQVFGPILGKDLNLSAEDIEIGLVKHDASLARLHIQILKVPCFFVVIGTCYCV